MTELTIEVQSALWLSSNQRLHRMAVAGISAKLREQAGWEAKAANLPKFEQVHVCAFIQYPTARRADPPNAWPTVKAILDGLTDAGIWADDDDTHVVATTFRRDPGKSPTGTYRIRLVLTDQALPFGTNVSPAGSACEPVVTMEGA